MQSVTALMTEPASSSETIRERALSDLIGRIYDCALDPTRWEATLGEICEGMGGLRAYMAIGDALTGANRMTTVFNMPPDAIEAIYANSAINPVVPLAMVFDFNEPFVGSRHTDLQSLHRSLYFQRAGMPFNHYDILVAGVARSLSTFGSWAVVGDTKKGVFTDDDVGLARLVLPHVRRAAMIGDQLAFLPVAEGTIKGVLEALAAGALLIGPNGAILFTNAAADAELRSGRYLREAKGKLVAASPEVARLVADLSDGRAVAQQGRDLMLTDAAGVRTQFTWVRLEGGEFGDQAPFLVMIRSPEPDMVTPIAAAARAFGLTGAETQVLAQVLAGRTVEETADILGVARSTAKTHLAALLAKTGARRQPDLVRTVMGLMTPMG